MIAVVLQNAWARTPMVAARMAGNQQLWRRFLARSHSGRRLRELLGDDCFVREGVEFLNTTPAVGLTADAKLPPDLAYLRRQLRALKPALVIACGRQAEESTVATWNGPLLAVPHPASRTVTNRLYRAAGRMIESGFGDRLALRQLPHRHRKEPIEKVAA